MSSSKLIQESDTTSDGLSWSAAGFIGQQWRGASLTFFGWVIPSFTKLKNNTDVCCQVSMHSAERKKLTIVPACISHFQFCFYPVTTPQSNFKKVSSISSNKTKESFLINLSHTEGYN